MFLLPFSVVGVSHETNAEDLLGTARLLPERQALLLDALRERGVHAVLLSTCHRTELYWWGAQDLESWFADQILSEHRSAASIERRDADLAVRHLFAVAAGMHSRRFGEPEVLGQVRQAWRNAQTAKATSSDLDAVFRQAIDAARHIRLAIGTSSQASLGVSARTAFDEYTQGYARDHVRLLVVGAGDAARSVLEAFSNSHSPAVSRAEATAATTTVVASPVASTSGGPRFALAITSRTDDRAERLANQFRATPVSWVARESAMCAADVVVFAAHTTTPLIRDDAARAIIEMRQAPSLWIDVGVPGNVQLAIALPRLRVVRLNDLEGQQPLDRAVHARASSALQRELARFTAATHRRRLGAQLADIEHRALIAVRNAIEAAEENAVAEPPAEAVARRVARVLLRELSTLQ